MRSGEIDERVTGDLTENLVMFGEVGGGGGGRKGRKRSSARHVQGCWGGYGGSTPCFGCVVIAGPLRLASCTFVPRRAL
jgi:hypothetical protein